MLKDIDGQLSLNLQTTRKQRSFTLRDILSRKQFIDLTKRLSPETVVVNANENIHKHILLGCGVAALYEPLTLFPRRGHKDNRKNHGYVPDFLLPFNYIEGKPIVIESHSGDLLDVDYLERLNKMRKEYGLYIAVSSDLSELQRSDSVDSRIIRVYGKEFVDQLWFSIGHDRGLYVMHRIKGLLRKSEVRPENALTKIIERLDDIKRRSQ